MHTTATGSLSWSAVAFLSVAAASVCRNASPKDLASPTFMAPRRRSVAIDQSATPRTGIELAAARSVSRWRFAPACCAAQSGRCFTARRPTTIQPRSERQCLRGVMTAAMLACRQAASPASCRRTTAMPRSNPSLQPTCYGRLRQPTQAAELKR